MTVSDAVTDTYQITPYVHDPTLSLRNPKSASGFMIGSGWLILCLQAAPPTRAKEKGRSFRCAPKRRLLEGEEELDLALTTAD